MCAVRSSCSGISYTLYAAGFLHAYHTQHTGVSRFQWTTFASVEPINLPSLEVQRRLRQGILSPFDVSIENNLRRVRILERAARLVYREWFVEVRAPMEPAARRLLRECLEVNPKVVVPREGEKPFVPMGALSNHSMLIGNVEQRTGNSGSKFTNGDTLFARITPCLENGKTGFVQFLPDARSVAFGSTEFIVLRSRTLTPEFVYLLARTDEFRARRSRAWQVRAAGNVCRSGASTACRWYSLLQISSRGSPRS